MKLSKIIVVLSIAILALSLILIRAQKAHAKKVPIIAQDQEVKNCPLCSSGDFTQHMNCQAWNNRDGIELRKCTTCKFVYSAAALFEYDDFSAQESLLMQTREQLMRRAQHERLPELIDEIVAKSGISSGKSLDFGCGIGLNSLCLQDRGFTTFGVELSNPYIEKHKQLHIASVKSVADFDQSHELFDFIIMKDVLEHVQHPKQILSQVLAYLIPGGFFYIRVPNVYHYPFHWSIDTKSHINHFCPHQLMALVEENGLHFVDFIGIYDISTKVGKLYNMVFWPLRNYVPMYHQISLLYRKI